MTIRLFIFLALSCCFSANANAQTKPTISVDLTAVGLPQDAFVRKNYKECPHQYFGYRSVEWLDENRLLVAFNTSPACALKPGLLDGSLRLATFDVQGKMLHSADITYQAGNGDGIPVISHGGIWIGPDHTVVVAIPSPHLKSLPDARDKVLVFSDQLTQIQEIDADDHARIGDGLHFVGVTSDRRRVIFSAPGNGETKHRTCVSYSEFPATTTTECSSYDLDSFKHHPDMTGVPKGYDYVAFPGASADGLRSSVFAVKQENASCETFGKFCRSKGTLAVFDTNTKRTLLKIDIPRNGRATLSPDGHSLAVLQQNKLETFAIP